MEALSKGEALQEQLSSEVVILIGQFKQKIIDLVQLVDTIRQRCYEEGLNDHDVWTLLNHALEHVEINKDQKRKLLAPFRPPPQIVFAGTDPVPEKRISNMESFEGNFEFFFPFKLLDENVAMAKRTLFAMLKNAEDGFYIKTANYKINNIKPDKTDMWIIPEGPEDEAFIS